MLGEFFRCRYDYPDGSHGFYVAEQVSHHPPISAFYYASPVNRIIIMGELRPKSKFLGNSVSTTMEGENRVILLGKPEDGGTSPYSSCSGSQFDMLCRIRDNNAKYVRPWYTLWQDGARARGHMYRKERERETALRLGFQNQGACPNSWHCFNVHYQTPR